jgi:hypothetical protein
MFIDWWGLQYLIMIALIGSIFYFYRIRFKCTKVIGNNVITLIVDYNFIGFKFIKVLDSNGNTVIQVRTKKEKYSFSNTVLNLCGNITLTPKEGRGPVAIIKHITPS